MATAAMAIVTRIGDAGTFNNAGIRQLSVSFDCIIVGIDDTAFNAKGLIAIFDLTGTLAAMGAAMQVAISALAIARGYNIAANNMLVPSFTRL